MIMNNDIESFDIFNILINVAWDTSDFHLIKLFYAQGLKIYNYQKRNYI